MVEAALVAEEEVKAMDRKAVTSFLARHKDGLVDLAANETSAVFIHSLRSVFRAELY